MAYQKIIQNFYHYMARQTNLSLHWTQFKDLKRQMQRDCRRSYNKYMSDIIHDSYVNSKKKKLFSFIKSLRKDYCGIPTLQKDGLRHDDNPIQIYLILRSIVKESLAYLMI